jgi:glycosyltransferase involved in cell wall biosynthesis
MRVLSIGTDRKIFEEGSAACARQLAYAQKLGELDVVVLSRGESLAQFSEQTLSVYPTRSALRLTYVLGARRIARSLRRPDVVTVQDPFETGLIGLRIARMLGVPLHVQVHTDLTSPAFRRHSLMNRIRYHIAWYVLRRASRVRVILARTKDELVAAGITASIEVLPIFVDLRSLFRCQILMGAGNQHVYTLVPSKQAFTRSASSPYSKHSSSRLSNS